MNYDILFKLSIEKNKLISNASFKSTKDITTFKINKNIKINSCNHKYESKIEKDAFFGEVLQVTVYSNKEKVEFNYTTDVVGWLSGINNDFILLNVYSLCALMSINEEIKLSKTVFDDSFNDYLILNSTIEENKRVSYYNVLENLEYINVIALKKNSYSTIDVNDGIAYYFDDSDKEYADFSINTLMKARKFFNTLFTKKKFDKLKLCFFPNQTEPGCYYRKNLIVGSTLKVKKNDYGICHEMAHDWFMNAYVNSFEDWLNETGAEWAYFLFLLNNDKEDAFNERMNLYKNFYPKCASKIRTDDLKRPENVHICGVCLFYNIYKKYGKDSIKKLLQILANNEKIDTSTYLKEIKDNNLINEYEYIKNNLDNTFVIEK